MNYHNSSRGFTLIELLVVIAIIGILSSVVLASLNTARSKGQDAAIQSDLSTVQTQAEIYYGGGGNNTYGAAFTAGTCPTAAGTMFYDDTTIRRAIEAAQDANSAGTVECVAAASPAAYAVKAQLVADNTKFWCVDSTGFAGLSTGSFTAQGCTPAP